MLTEDVGRVATWKTIIHVGMLKYGAGKNIKLVAELGYVNL
jgi:hypothetical protein